MGVSKLLILEMLCVLLVVIGSLDGLLEEIVERVEQFSLFGGFQISEPPGYLVLTKGLQGQLLLRLFLLVPYLPVLLDCYVLIHSLRLYDFTHQQSRFFIIFINSI
jgi:hypothetical protein